MSLRAELAEHLPHHLADLFRRGVEGGGIEIALQGYLVASQSAGGLGIDGPIQPQHIRPALLQLAQPGHAALGEIDHRHPGTADRLDDLLHIGQGEFPEAGLIEDARPGVEQLDRLGPGVDLGPAVVDHRGGNLPQQLVEQFRPGKTPLLGHLEIFRTSSFHHVGRQGPGRTAKSDQRHPAVQLPAHQANRIHHKG